MSRSKAREIVALYGEWRAIEVDLAMILATSRLEERHQISFWYALIVEAANRAGASRLVTEDLRSGRRMAGVRIENPFK